MEVTKLLICTWSPGNPMSILRDHSANQSSPLLSARLPPHTHHHTCDADAHVANDVELGVEELLDGFLAGLHGKQRQEHKGGPC